MGVSYLLDTHAVVWLIGSQRPPRAALVALLEAADARVVVSSVSAYELGTKVRLGKLASAAALIGSWRSSIRQLGAVELDLKHQHAIRAAGLDWVHRDPFDRLLVAQAQVEGLTLVSADRAMRDAPDIDVPAW